MDAQAVIDTALAAGAATLGAPEAAKILRQQIAHSIRCNVMLLPHQRSILRKSVDFPILFMQSYAVTNDHPMLVACRGLVRDIFEAEFAVSNASERVLVVGAAVREIKKYQSNPHIHYYVYGKENKDYDRIVRPALRDIACMLKKKAGKMNGKVFIMPGSTEPRGIVKRYHNAERVFKDYMATHAMPASIHLDPVRADTLVFEDSFYNYTPKMWVDIFKKTGAKIAYGYGLLPYELIFPEMAVNPIYSIHRPKPGKVAITFREGYNNGYVHDEESWSTLLKHPVIAYGGLKLAVEITSRVGPMACFKVYRVRYTEDIVRCLELPSRLRYVKILDIFSSVNPRTGRIANPLKYMSVVEDEYLDIFNYLISLDPKSVSYANTVAYIRRRMGGMSLITKELVEPWFMEKRLLYKVALTVLLEVKVRMADRDRIVDGLDIGSVWEKMRAWFRRTAGSIFYPIRDLIDWIMSGHLVDSLVLDCEGNKLQFASVECGDGWSKVEESFADLYLDNPYEGDIPNCEVCQEMMGKMGEQEVRCVGRVSSAVTLALSDDQVNQLRTSLIDTDNDAPGLAAVKKRCAESMPTTGFSLEVQMRYIRAGPGCGKSHGIRQLATTSDLIMAPFTKLKSDYMGLRDEAGDSYDLQFKTTHRAMESRGCKRIFVDEFTSLPYEYLACVAYMNGAEEIFLVGDERQTKVQEPAEGMYIGNHVDLSKLCTHEFLVNFRNPRDTVALLNKTFGYEMRAKSEREKSIKFVTRDELPEVVAARMAFSQRSATDNVADSKATVRSFQGGTFDNVVLFCTNLDGELPACPDLQIVALSRHKEVLYVVGDGGDTATKFEALLGLDPDFYEHMNTWLTFPNEDVRPVYREDKIVDEIIKPTQPPKDMHLLNETFLPAVAFVEGDTAINSMTSALIGDQFASGVTNPDLVIMPCNKRGHPLSLETRYFSMSQGIGNHFTSKSPAQVLQVLQARYFCKQPFFAFGHKEKNLVIAIVNAWMNEQTQDISGNFFDTAEIQDVVNGFLKKVLNQNYQKAFRANGGIDSPEGRVVRFNLKGIFKPKHMDVDPYKAGQGISAWSTDANAMFCSVFRLLNRLAIKCEKPNVITDSYKSETEFLFQVTEQLSKLPAPAQFATTDGIQFDANQNIFTQQLEQVYWKAHGVPEEFLEHYYSFRKRYKIISSVAIGFAGTQKTSGEPGTLPNNGVVSKLISNYLVTGEGPSVTIYKGDDYTKRQLNLVVNEKRKMQIDAVCDLKLRVKIAPSTDFCGLTFNSGKLFPSIPRKANKIQAHRFRTYEHFCEFQSSIRDWTRLMTILGEMETVALNADHYKTSLEEMQDCFDFIKSIGHLNKEQFFDKFKHRVETAVIPTANPHSTRDFVEAAGPSVSTRN